MSPLDISNFRKLFSIRKNSEGYNNCQNNWAEHFVQTEWYRLVSPCSSSLSIAIWLSIIINPQNNAKDNQIRILKSDKRKVNWFRISRLEKQDSSKAFNIPSLCRSWPRPDVSQPTNSKLPRYGHSYPWALESLWYCWVSQISPARGIVECPTNNWPGEIRSFLLGLRLPSPTGR